MIPLTFDDRTRVEPSVTSGCAPRQRKAMSDTLLPCRGLIYATPERAFGFELDSQYFFGGSRFQPEDFLVVENLGAALSLVAEIPYEFIIMAGPSGSEQDDLSEIIRSIPYVRATLPTIYFHRIICPAYYKAADGPGRGV